MDCLAKGCFYIFFYIGCLLYSKCSIYIVCFILLLVSTLWFLRIFRILRIWYIITFGCHCVQNISFQDIFWCYCVFCSDGHCLAYCESRDCYGSVFAYSCIFCICFDVLQSCKLICYYYVTVINVSVILYSNGVMDCLAKGCFFTFRYIRCFHYGKCSIQVFRCDGFFTFTFYRLTRWIRSLCCCNVHIGSFQNIFLSNHMCGCKCHIVDSLCWYSITDWLQFINCFLQTSQCIFYNNIFDGYITIIGYCDGISHFFTKCICLTILRFWSFFHNSKWRCRFFC